MIIKEVRLNNFRPYFGFNKIDLSVNPEQNIILIGGRNGQGKTSLLVGLVWCIYGEKIAKVDEIFRKEVKGNYSRFLSSALNRRAESNHINEFSVSITFSDVELSEVFISDKNQNKSNICLTRTYNTEQGKENFLIEIDGQEMQLVYDDKGKIDFVNDYLIPLDAAKFVFFDAEKISEIADMNIKDQGRTMNEALGKILGLSKYEELADNLKQYIKDIKQSKSQKSTIHNQIENQNNKIKLCKNDIEQLSAEMEEIENTMDSLNREINSIEKYLTQNGAKILNIDIDELERKKNIIELQKEKLGDRLKDISEIIPFAISAGRIGELVETLKIENEISLNENSLKEVKEKSDSFVEKLFEQPPFPSEKYGGDIKTPQKYFYMNKATEVFLEVYSKSEDQNEILPFKHDLNRATEDYIKGILGKLKNGEDLYQNVFDDYIRLKNELSEISQQLNKAKAKATDPLLTDYKEKLDSKKTERDKLLQEKGKADLSKNNRQIELTNAENVLENLYGKVEVSKNEQGTIDIVNKHITALEEFITLQKKNKTVSLSSTLKAEMKRLMHKKDLFDEVQISILPEDGGLDVKLLKNKLEVPKESLSSGEKQIYISCLLKAILEESVTEFPVIIDTPLGRLDREHKDNFIDKYYPFLANQVIILTTDEEVTLARKERINNRISETYYLINEEESTKIIKGYFY